MHDPPTDPTARHLEADANPSAASLRHLVVVCAVAMCVGAMTYVVPALGDVKPWTPSDGVPIARLFGKAATLPEFAGAGGSYRSAGATPDNVREALGDTVAANLPASRAQQSTPKDPAPSNGEPDATPLADTQAQYMIDPDDYAGIDTFLVDPTGDGMRPFYKALLRTALTQDAATTRIAHYGDSSIATDLITSTVRTRFQERFGDAGHGFVLPARGYLPYRHKGVRLSDNDAWSVREIVRKDDRSGHYGLGGNVLIARKGAWSRIGTSKKGSFGGRVQRFDVHYQTHPRGGTFSIRLDKGETTIVETSSAEVGDAVHTIETTDGGHFIELRKRKGGPVHLYGVVLERPGPGVVYDSLGLVGARALRLTNYDREHISQQIARRGTNLMVLGFGGNEASDNKDEEHYYQDYRSVLETMRPDRQTVGCLVITPLDQAKRTRGRIRTMPSLARIVAAQKRAAEDFGCAFYNTWQAMGGEGSMARWYRIKPRLAMGDFRHATPLGYEVVGNMLYKAMLAGFADWLKTQPQELRE